MSNCRTYCIAVPTYSSHYKSSRNATHFHIYLYMGKISFQAFLCLDFSENKLFIAIKHVERYIVLSLVSNKILYVSLFSNCYTLSNTCIIFKTKELLFFLKNMCTFTSFWQRFNWTKCSPTVIRNDVTKSIIKIYILPVYL